MNPSMQRRPRALYAAAASLALFLVATACSDHPPAPAPDGPVQIESLPELPLTEEARIGSVDDPERGFSRIAGVDVGSDGRVYVFDGQDMQIRVLSPAGDVVARIGGPGEGPGEFQNFVRFGVRGDTLWTVELPSNRITFFHVSGDLVGTSVAERLRIPLPGTYATVLPERMEPGGTFLGWMGMVGRRRDEAAPDVTEDDDLSWPRVRFSAGGEVIDTVARIHRPPPRLWRPSSEEPGSFRTVEVGGRPRIVPSPPTLLPQWLPRDDGYAVVEATLPDADGGEVALIRIALSGDSVGVTRLRYDAARWTSAELDTLAARAARGGGFLPMSGSAPPVPDNWQEIAARLRAEMDFPDYRVALDYGWGASDGSVLLRFSEGEVATDATFVLLDPDGTPVGHFRLQKAARPLWTDGRTLWVSEPDEFAVPWLVRYRMG